MRTPARIGPYELLDEVGRGGMGIVYRARDARTGVNVALKTVRVPKEELLASLRREIHGLARARHPGVVRILDEGLQDGVPWYAMELLQGLTLRDHRRWIGSEDASGLGPGRMPTEVLAASPPAEIAATAVHDRVRADPSPADAHAPPLDPSSLRQILTLVRRLCAPLAYLHGEGVVHRDLKPDNILVKGDGAPVLMDFGLAALSFGVESREVLDDAGLSVGTAWYMAPEQGRGELVDARADLYSLGCVLYELLTGRPPFVGARTAQILWQHQAEAPAPPSSHAPWIPADLDALVIALLEKRPRDRIGHAGAVSSWLARLGAGGSPERHAPKSRAYLYRPGLCGRAGVLKELARPFAPLRKGAGGVVLLAGESGSGKTRIAIELATDARMQGLAVLTGECGPVGSLGGVALCGLKKVLRAIADRCLELGAAEVERVLGHRARVLAAHEPALADLPGVREMADPVILGHEEARARLFLYLSETLHAFVDGRPLVLLIDDLHWADDLTLGYVRHVLASGPSGTLVVATYRSEELGPVLAKLAGEVSVVRVPRLDDAAVGEMVVDMLAMEAPPAPFLELVARQAEGNPFFVCEYLRAATHEGILARDEDGRWQVAMDAPAALGLPGSVRGLLERRLAGLGRAARPLLAAASVLGQEMASSILEEVAALGERDGLEAGSDLVARHVLEEVPGTSRLRFVHDTIREIAYELLPEAERRALHHRAASALARRPARSHADLAALGDHWERAGIVDRARPGYLEGARLAAKVYALPDAERLYRRFLALSSTETPLDVLARRELGEQVLRVLGRTEEAIVELSRALAGARAIGPRSEVANAQRVLGSIVESRGQFDEAEERLGEALRVAREIGDARIEGVCLGNLAVLLYNRGRIDASRDLYHQALAIARAEGDGARECRWLANLASFDHMQGRLDESLESYEAALAKARELGERALEAQVLGNMGGALITMGSVDRGAALLGEAIALNRALGARAAEASDRHNLAIALTQRGHDQEALVLHEECVRIAREIGQPRVEAASLTAAANLLARAGRVDDARPLFEAALARSSAIDDPSKEGQALVHLMELERLTGDLDAIPALLDRARRCAARASDVFLEADCSVVEVALAIARGDDHLPALARAREMASSLRLGGNSYLRADVERLELAAAARSEGREADLHRGDLVSLIPPGLRRWLVECGRIPAGPAV